MTLEVFIEYYRSLNHCGEFLHRGGVWLELAESMVRWYEAQIIVAFRELNIHSISSGIVHLPAGTMPVEKRVELWLDGEKE